MADKTLGDSLRLLLLTLALECQRSLDYKHPTNRDL